MLAGASASVRASHTAVISAPATWPRRDILARPAQVQPISRFRLNHIRCCRTPRKPMLHAVVERRPRPPFAWPSLRCTSEEGCQGRLLCRVVLVSATANPPKRNPESAQNFPRKILGRLRQKMRPAAEARNHYLVATIDRRHTRLAAARSRKKRQDRATRIDRCRQREKCLVRSARSRSANHSSVSSLSSGGSSPSSAG